MTEPLIYIIDPNSVQGNLIKYHLTTHRFPNTWFFPSVEECFYRVIKQAPDFLISETQIGNYTGLQLLLMCKKISPRTRVVFFSSSDDPHLATTLLSEGATDFIVKSARLETSLSELIQNLEFVRAGTFAG